MNNSQVTHRRRKLWQTSLRSLFLFMLLTGTMAGLFGPRLVRSLREWNWEAEPQPPPPLQVPAWVKLREEDQSDGYYESAETPLR